MIRIATRVPDHGRLAPWRFILYRGEARHEIGEQLAALAESAKARCRRAGCSRRRTRFSRAPLVIGVVSEPKDTSKNPAMGDVPVRRRGGDEPGDRRQCAWLRRQLDHQLVFRRGGGRRILGLAPHERVVGFVHIGTFAGALPERPRPEIAALYADYRGRGKVEARCSTNRRRPRAAARSVQGDRGAASDRLDLDAERGRRGQPRALFVLQRVLERAAAGLVLVRRREGQRQPSPTRRGEFVANLVGAAIWPAKMNATSVDAPRGVSEFGYAGLTPAPSRLVAPPRVAGAPAALECRVTEVISPEGARRTCRPAPSWSSAKWSASTSTTRF